MIKPIAVIVGIVFVGSLVASVGTVLYALTFGGSWLPAQISIAVTIAVWVAAKIFSLLLLDADRQLFVSGSISELFSGAFGWIAILLALAAPVLLVRAIFFDGPWLAFLFSLAVAAIAKRLMAFCEVTKQAATFKRELVKRGMTKEQARQEWIAHARTLVRPRPGQNA